MKIKKILDLLFTNSFKKQFTRTAAVVFSVTSTVFTFIPLQDILSELNINTLFSKTFLIIILFFITCLFSKVILCVKKTALICSNEGHKVIAEYGDITKLFANTATSTRHTLVIPVNTNLKYLNDEKVIKPNSIHGMWLNKLYAGSDTKKYREKISKAIEERFSQKDYCSIGDVIYLEDCLGVDCLLVASSEIEMIGNSYAASCSELQYLYAIQSVINAISTMCVSGTDIYIPLISAGYANSRDKLSIDYLKMMASIFTFNSHSLRNTIHILISEKSREYIDIFSIAK